MIKKAFYVSLFMAILTAGGVVYTYRYLQNHPQAPANLPPPQTYINSESTSENEEKEPSTVTKTIRLPDEVNLFIPFTSQAPFKKWDTPYKEFCEEASVLMGVSFLKGLTSITPEEADVKMLAIKEFEEKRFGYYEDTGVEDVAVILREFYGIKKVEVVYSPTVDDIKRALASNKAVIMPAAGQQLGNPHFRRPGPPYHMLILKGYTKDGFFITNDPGTQYGADYTYKEEVLMNAMHDWNGGNFSTGAKAVIILG